MMWSASGGSTPAGPPCRAVPKLRTLHHRNQKATWSPLGKAEEEMMDLTTDYLGLKLKSPLVVSSSPLTESMENILRLEEAGAAAVVLPSIFEEQLALESNALDSDLSRGTESYCRVAQLLSGV